MVSKISKCFNCGDYNEYNRGYCKSCGIINIVKGSLCSNCKEPVKKHDVRCFNCGENIIDTPPPEENMYQFDEKEKNKFIEEITKKASGIKLEYFREIIERKLNSYTTIKLLMRKDPDPPEELQRFYEIEESNSINETFEYFSKKFFSFVVKEPLLAPKYSNLVISLYAYYLMKLEKNGKSITQPLWITLKSNESFYENILQLANEGKVKIEVYKNLIINKTFQLMLPYNEEDKQETELSRAGAMNRLGELIEEKGGFTEEVEHLFFNTYKANFSIVRDYWYEWKIGKAVKRLKNLVYKFPQVCGKFKDPHIYDIVEYLFVTISDSLDEVRACGYCTEEYLKGVEQIYQISLSLSKREDWKNKGMDIFVIALTICETIVNIDPNKILETEIIQKLTKIIFNYYKEKEEEADFIKCMNMVIDNSQLNFRSKIIKVIIETIEKNRYNAKDNYIDRIIKKLKE